MFTLIDQTLGESLMRWTIQLAVGCVVGRWLVQAGRKAPTVPTRVEGWLWGLGCLAYLGHVVLAFEFVHRWSHLDAWKHTAQETARVTGVSRGDGVWVNYVFTCVWIADVVRLARARLAGRPTSPPTDRIINVIFCFVVFNATVVFGPSYYRWLALPVLVGLGLRWRQRAGSGARDL